MAFKKMTKHEILVKYGHGRFGERPENLRFRARIEIIEGQGRKFAAELCRRARIAENATDKEIFAAQDKHRQAKAKARAAKKTEMSVHG